MNCSMNCAYNEDMSPEVQDIVKEMPPVEEQRFWCREHSLPTRIALPVTVGLGLCVALLLLSHSVLGMVLSAVFVWIAVRMWLTGAVVLIDTQERVICRRDLRLGILMVERVVGLDGIARLKVRTSASPWWTCAMLGFGPQAAAYELVAQTAEGESIVVWEYGIGEQALAEGLHLSRWLRLPLVEAIFGKEHTVGQTNGGYIELLSQTALHHLPARPAAARAQCEVGQKLVIILPRPRLAARRILWLVVFPLAMAGLGVLYALEINRHLKDWVVWAAVLGGGVALAICLWTLWQALRRRVTLTVVSQGMTYQVQCGSTFKATQIETAALRDITVVRNGGPVDTAALWLGRQAVCILSEDKSLAFGLGLAREELLWIKQAIDWVLSGRPMKDVARAAAGRGLEILVPAEDIPESQSLFPQPAGPSAIRRSVRVRFGTAACYLAIMAGATLTWLLVSPQAGSGSAAVVDPANREKVQEIQRMMNTPEMRRVREAQEQAVREGRPLKDVLLQTLRRSATTRSATAPATESVDGSH